MIRGKSELAAEQCRRYGDLKGKRDGIWSPMWQRLANYFLPQMSDITSDKSVDESWTNRIFDDTAVLDAEALRAGQMNWLTPATEPWAAFEVPYGFDQKGGDEASLWLAKCSDTTMEVMGASNFYQAVSEDYLSVSVFGTGLIFCEEVGLATGELNFLAVPINTYCIAESDQGIVDTVYREFKMTTRQIKQKWGEDALTDNMKKALQSSKGLDKEWAILHCVFPREDSSRLPEKKDGENMAFASVYVALQGKEELSVSGYHEMPYLCSRFDRISTRSNTSWGYSPAFLVRATVSQLNEYVRWQDALAELQANPRVLIPDNLDPSVDMGPGGKTYFDHKKPEALPKEWATSSRYDIMEQEVVYKRSVIDKAFYVYIFQMLQQLQDKKMTAYEVAQRLSENLQQFTPVFNRRIKEFLNPLLRRVFGILYRAGKYGVAPQSLMVPVPGPKRTTARGKPLPTAMALSTPAIAITSRIGLAMKALQNQGIINTLSIVEQLGQSKPEVWDNLDADSLVRDLASNNGVAPDILVDKASMQKRRAKRTELMQQDKALQQAALAAKAGKDLEKSPDSLKTAALQKLNIPE